MSSFTSGDRIGTYMVVMELGVGGFALVYLVVDTQQQKLFAMKMSQGALDPKDLTRFLEEAERGKDLSKGHPHILPLHEVAVYQGHIPYVVMDYAPNGSLRDLLEEVKGPLDHSLVMLYGEQIASALQYVHNKKLIHRDVKPENILLGPRMKLWLADFGIAVMAHSTQSMALQEKVCTPLYVSPEQLQGFPRVESDQYSFAFMLYEMLSGTQGYAGTTGYVIAQHLTGPIPSLPPELLAPKGHIPVTVNDILSKAMAKEPKDRYKSVWKFWQTLKQAMLQTTQTITSPHVVTSDAATTVLPQTKPAPSGGSPFFRRYARLAPRSGRIVVPAVIRFLKQYGKHFTLDVLRNPHNPWKDLSYPGVFWLRVMLGRNAFQDHQVMDLLRDVYTKQVPPFCSEDDILLLQKEDRVLLDVVKVQPGKYLGIRDTGTFQHLLHEAPIIRFMYHWPTS